MTSVMTWVTAVTAAWALPSGAEPTQPPDWEASGSDWEVGVLDADGDGFGDIVMVSDRTDALWLWYGSMTGPGAVPDLQLPFPAPLEPPTRVEVGDFYGDGHDDLLLSSVLGDWTAVYPGAIHGLGQEASFSLEGELAPRAVGDLDGDGADEIAVVHPPTFDLYRGGPHGPTLEPAWDRSACDAAEVIGLDANGDGFGDLVIACADADLQLALGGPAGPGAPVGFGARVPYVSSSASGDFDADGFEDLAIGLTSVPSIARGTVWMWRGSADGLLPSAWSVSGSDTMDSVGSGLAAGDLDGDGDAELLVGAIGVVTGVGGGGRVVRFDGDPSGLGTTPSWIYDGDAQSGGFGQQLETGDVNGDGADDLLLASAASGGALRLFHGEPPDRDQDGFAGARDCDDLDPDIFPGAPEVDGDGVDQDCDGLDAALGVADLSPGDLVFTEVLAQPLATDLSGRWVELALTGDAPVDLLGLDLGWGRSTATVDRSLVLSPGERLVVGVEADPLRNGGVPVDLVVPGLSLDAELTLSIEGALLDAVTVPDLPAEPGIAAQRYGGGWCAATRPYGQGDLGTPGEPNDPCADDSGDPADPEPKAPSGGGCGCHGAPFAPVAPGFSLLVGLALAVRTRRR